MRGLGNVRRARIEEIVFGLAMVILIQSQKSMLRKAEEVMSLGGLGC